MIFMKNNNIITNFMTINIQNIINIILFNRIFKLNYQINNYKNNFNNIFK